MKIYLCGPWARKPSASFRWGVGLALNSYENVWTFQIGLLLWFVHIDINKFPKALQVRDKP